MRLRSRILRYIAIARAATLVRDSVALMQAYPRKELAAGVGEKCDAGLYKVGGLGF